MLSTNLAPASLYYVFLHKANMFIGSLPLYVCISVKHACFHECSRLPALSCRLSPAQSYCKTLLWYLKLFCVVGSLPDARHPAICRSTLPHHHAPCWVLSNATTTHKTLHAGHVLIFLRYAPASSCWVGRRAASWPLHGRLTWAWCPHTC